MPKVFHRRFMDLVDAIEHAFPVTHWRGDDVPVWPLARMELYLDMHFASIGAARPAVRPFAWRSLARAALPIRNAWRSRRDLAHFLRHPHDADVIVLGDGVSLDWVKGAWRDRFTEPIIAALQDCGRKSFLMQSSDLSRLPWHRPTYAANNIAARGAQLAAALRIDLDLAEHDEVLKFLAHRGVPAPSLAREALHRTATHVSATATAFEQVIEIVAPSLAFVVNYYSGLGPAFVLACRRRGILAVDLQHCPQQGAHKAYAFSALPAHGYDVLPDVFWNWTQRDAEHVRSWAKFAARDRHRSIHGGHTQIAAYLNDGGGAACEWHDKFAAACGGVRFDQEILIALQPLGGHRADWDALRACIDAAPATWRWWIRRHPAARPGQDEEYASLLRIDRPNVEVTAAGVLPLPVLLRHMTALVSLASGAAAEAAVFGVPAFFLSEGARDTFFDLIERGQANVVAVQGLNAALAALGNGTDARQQGSFAAAREPVAPALADTLRQLQQWAQQLAGKRLAGRFQPYGHTRPNRYPWLFSFASAQLARDPPCRTALRLLSFGCSRGDEVFSLREYFPRAVIKGIDIDPRNIAECQRRLARRARTAITFATAASTLEEPAAYYDAIFCLAVLCCGDLTTSEAETCAPRLHFADFERLVADFARCLKPGGLLLLHTANFRFSDTSVAAQFDTVLHAAPEQMAPDLLYDRDNRRITQQRHYAVAFRKKHAGSASIAKTAALEAMPMTDIGQHL
jgi:SAM-dependent methyltransferase